MKAAIMQPYFLPYIGYFQLIAAVDLFIMYDNIKYTKKGWINRNRMLQNGQAAVFSLPLKGDSDSLDVRDRELAGDFKREKLLNQISGAYRPAPFFAQTFPVIEEVVRFEDRNLFRFVEHSIRRISQHLGITTEVRRSSDVAADHSLKSQDRVLALCEAVGAKNYVNPIGGVELYSRDDFKARGVKLEFITSKPFDYAQFDSDFVPWLSIADVMMFNPLAVIQDCVATQFDLV